MSRLRLPLPAAVIHTVTGVSGRTTVGVLPGSASVWVTCEQSLR